MISLLKMLQFTNCNFVIRVILTFFTFFPISVYLDWMEMDQAIFKTHHAFLSQEITNFYLTDSYLDSTARLLDFTLTQYNKGWEFKGLVDNIRISGLSAWNPKDWQETFSNLLFHRKMSIFKWIRGLIYDLSDQTCFVRYFHNFTGSFSFELNLFAL